MESNLLHPRIGTALSWKQWLGHIMGNTPGTMKFGSGRINQILRMEQLVQEVQLITSDIRILSSISNDPGARALYSLMRSDDVEASSALNGLDRFELERIHNAAVELAIICQLKRRRLGHFDDQLDESPAHEVGSNKP